MIFRVESLRGGRCREVAITRDPCTAQEYARQGYVVRSDVEGAYVL